MPSQVLSRSLYAISVALILEDHRVGRVVVVLEPEAAEQPQLIVRIIGLRLDHDVHARVLIVPVAGRVQLARDHTAARKGLALEQQHLLAGLGQVRRRHQAIVARAHAHHVVVLRHRCLPLTAARCWRLFLAVTIGICTMAVKQAQTCALRLPSLKLPMIAPQDRGRCAPEAGPGRHAARRRRPAGPGRSPRTHAPRRGSGCTRWSTTWRATATGAAIPFAKCSRAWVIAGACC